MSLSDDEWREAFERPDMTTEEIEEFRRGLRTFLSQFLDHFFREEFEPYE